MSLSLVKPIEGHVIVMAGAVNPGTVIALHRAIAAAVDCGHRVIVIDVSAVTGLSARTAEQRMLAPFAGSPHATRRPNRDPRRRLEVVADVTGNDAPADPFAEGTAA